MKQAADSLDWRDAALLALCIAVAGIASLAKGQDANWDLQNYHFYNPWAVLDGRIFSRDIVAAQLQTFHNPALDFVFYGMVAAGWPPRLIAFVLAVPAGVAAFFLGKIVLVLFPGPASATRATLRIAAFAIGVTGAIGLGVLGTTMNEWPIAALTIAAIFVLTRALVASEGAALPRRPLLLAGLLIGLAAGFKLTAATFAVAVCVALVLRRPFFRSPMVGLREAAWFAPAVALGLALSIGWWCVILWNRFDSPVFPYLNQWFRSPWWDPRPVLDRVFGPFTLEGWLTFPYDMFRPRPFFVAEVEYRDARMPTLYTLALVAGAASVASWVASKAVRRRRWTLDASNAPWLFVSVFWLAAFVLWTAQYGIYRYILTLELLSGALIVGLARYLVRTPVLPTAVTILALAVIATTRWPDWGRIPFGDRWFDVQAKALPPGALVVLASDAPVGHVLPYLAPDARFVGAFNSFTRPGDTTRLGIQSMTAIRDHRGPLYSLSHDAKMAGEVYAAHNLAVVDGSCTPVRTNMPGATLSLCELARVAP